MFKVGINTPYGKREVGGWNVNVRVVFKNKNWAVPEFLWKNTILLNLFNIFIGDEYVICVHEFVIAAMCMPYLLPYISFSQCRFVPNTIHYRTEICFLRMNQ